MYSSRPRSIIFSTASTIEFGDNGEVLLPTLWNALVLTERWTT